MKGYEKSSIVRACELGPSQGAVQSARRFGFDDIRAKNCPMR